MIEPQAPHIISAKNRIAWGTLAISFVALGLKYWAWAITGSVALYSDALETIINVVAAIGGLLALNIAQKPADDNHTYGHYKAEYLSAVVEGVMVLITAGSIAWEAWQSWKNPVMLTFPFLGIAINGAAGLVNMIWAKILLYAGRNYHSPALVAGGKHVLSDVWTTLLLIATLSFVPLTGQLWIDPLVAAIIACNILRVGYMMLRESIGGLMDEAPDTGTRRLIRDIIQQKGQGAIEAHDVRLRTVGTITFIDFHLVVPGFMHVEDAHAICDRIESELKKNIGPTLINIHVEPAREAKSKNAILISSS